MTEIPYSENYSDEYMPLAPVLKIKVSSTRKNTSEIEAMALVDTGADITILPTTIIEALKPKKVRSGTLRGLTGEGQLAQVYLVHLIVGRFPRYGVHAVSAPGLEHAILGRDVLNHFIITLNGPADVIEIIP